MQEGNLIYVFQHKIHKLIDLVVKYLKQILYTEGFD